MKITFLVKAFLFELAAGWGGSVPKGHEWHAPRAEDSRSPCPGLNVMANHGWLPRSGMDIDLNELRFAVHGAFNYAPTAFDDAFAQALAFNLTTTGNSSTFHLADLAKHDDVEFDGSLSRNDFYFGDDLHFDPAIWKTTADRLGLGKTGPSDMDRYVTVETAAKARAARVRDAMRANPTFNSSANQMTGTFGTTALYLVTLWDDKVGAAPKSWIKSFFENERIPYHEGYTLSETQKTLDTIINMTQRVQAVAV